MVAFCKRIAHSVRPRVELPSPAIIVMRDKQVTGECRSAEIPETEMPHGVHASNKMLTACCERAETRVVAWQRLRPLYVRTSNMVAFTTNVWTASVRFSVSLYSRRSTC